MRTSGPDADCSKAYISQLVRWLPNELPPGPQPDRPRLRSATVHIDVVGTEAYVTLSGGTLADAIGHLTLAKEKGHWTITSHGNPAYGKR